MIKNQFYRDVIKAIMGISVVLLLCRFTLGGMSVLVAVVGLIAAIMRKPTVMACCFILFPLIAIFNRAVIGVTGITLLIGKFTFWIMTVSAFLTSKARGYTQERLPIGWLALYLAVACLSSVDGWMPLISYLKLVNFAIMLTGIYLLAIIMQGDISSLYALRAVFMAMAVILIVGSLLSYFFPSIGFSMMIYKLEGYGVIMTGEALLDSGDRVLFNGMTCHSQMLSPVVASLGTWVLCDMLLIERKMTLLHGAVLSCIPPLLYMSRSRGGLLMLACTTIITFIVTIPRARLPQKVKRSLGVTMLVAIVALIGAGVYFQIKNEAISRWLRKTDDVATDTRTLEEAFTNSRQGSIEMNLYDFRLNPLLGKGFQVVNGMKQAYAAHMITWFSASVEKGVTPYVILGETGALGAFAFLIFLSAFYATCFRRGYMSLMTNFSCFLVANLADSTFFSPSGLGGFMWIVVCIGAFSTDCLSKCLHRMRQEEQYFAMQYVGGRV